MEPTELEVLRRKIDPSVKVGEVAFRALEPLATDFARAHVEIERMLANSESMRKAVDAFSGIARLGLESEAMYKAIMASTALSQKWADEILKFHQVTEKMALPYAEGVTKLSLATADMLKPYAEGVAKLSMVMSGADLLLKDGGLGKFLAEEADQRRLIADVFGMAGSYTKIVEGFRSTPDLVRTLPVELGRLSPLEVELHGDLLDAFSARDNSPMPISRERLASGVEQLLASIDPALVSMLDGARAALRSDNPDKVRHAVTSLRELMTHVLHLLAPDERVASWTKSPEDFNNGRPTRRARIRFICSFNAGSLFENFVESDIAAALKVFDLCHGGTHGLKQPLTEQQASVVIARAEGLLRYWMELAQRR